jgi:hypothetical protein
MTATQNTPTANFEAQPVQLRSTWLRATLGAMLVLIAVLSVRLLTVTPSEAAELQAASADSLGIASALPSRPSGLPVIPASATR